MTEGASNSRPPLLKGQNYGFWKLRMKAYICSINERAWMTVEEGYLAPNKCKNGVIDQYIYVSILGPYFLAFVLGFEYFCVYNMCFSLV